MESNNLASRVKPSSASSQPADRTVENRFAYDEIFNTASSPKVFFLELSKNIQVAEDNFDMAMKQWQEVKSRSQIESYDKSEAALSQSTSSYNSIKNASSETSTHKIHEVECVDEPEEKPTDDTSQLQVVLTPRSANKEEDEEVEPTEEVEVPVRAKNSLSSVKTTSKKPKKVKSKKKQTVKMNDEQMRTSLIYSAKAKRKKMHGRLKNSNSKSTIATRDTGFSDKKADRKKFKRQKSLDTISAFPSPQVRKRASTLKARESKQLDARADLIEIFHSKAMKSGSVSSRMSKEVARTVAEARKRKIQPTVVEKNVDPTPQIHLQDPFIQEKEEPEDKSNSPEQQYQEVHEHQHQQTREYNPTEVYDPFYPRNYEMPTMASKMKRVHKPYYHHFNIRNIPFVVGTSLSPSHNLGLNIQQVLSIIKVKQPAVPGISPLLIRKVSRGVRPVSTLFEHINNQYARTYRNLSRRRSRSHQQLHIGSYVSCEQLMRASSSLASQAAAFKQNTGVVCEPLYEEDEDNQSTCSDSRTRNSQQQQQERCRSRKQHNCQQLAEHGSNFGGRTCSSKEMSEVFTRLYDQFDKMVSQHERLKEQLEKRKDKSLIKEVSELETAMTAKEQEIAAVVNLYNEVNSLKKQMKLLHERNSFVCIATPDPSFQSVNTKVRARTAPVPFLDAKPSRREMPNALKLVGLLRQMQAFQRQLALA